MSIARQLSQLSIIASLGSIVTGFTLINRTRNGCEDKTSDTVGLHYLVVEMQAAHKMHLYKIAYLRSKKNAQLGLETLAIQLSLPYAMLLWWYVLKYCLGTIMVTLENFSSIAFLAAVLFMCIGLQSWFS